MTLVSPGYYFLSARARAFLPKYQYSGEDKSYLYKYLLSPLATFLVNRCTPRSISPNSITLCGLCFMITSYCIFWYHSPSLDPVPSVPSWIFAFHCFAMLIYQTLDNMDGKQARRTGSSSPLGLLFDHGCDAVNSIFGSANWIISIGLLSSSPQEAWKLWVLVLGPMGLFYVATWEEYHTGKLILPVVNGPNEGLLLGAMTSLTTCLLGVSYWQSTSWFDTAVEMLPSSVVLPSWFLKYGPWRNCDIQIMASCIGFVQETANKSIHVARVHSMNTLFGLVPFVALTVLTFVIGMCDPAIFIRMPRTSLHLIAGLFIEMCTQLMLDHITHETFRWFRWALLPLVALTVMVVSGVWQASDTTDEYLVMYNSGLWAFLATKMTIVISEMCALLNIWCFDIVTPRNTEPDNGMAINGSQHAKEQ